MASYISFGKYNNLYKYIWIYLIINIIYDYIFGNTFPNQMKFTIFETNNYPPNILIQQGFNYIGSFILSIFIFIYERSQIGDNNNLMSKFLKKHNFHNTLIYQKEKTFIELIFKIFPIAFINVISVQLINNILNIGLTGLDFWMFDLFFIAYVNYLKFGKEIFNHKKFAILFVLIFATLFKASSTFVYIFDDSFDLIYKKYVLLIPLGSIGYILSSLLRNYSLCKIKWLLDYKYISIGTFLLIYNFIGTIMILIPSLVVNNNKCVDKNTFKDINTICHIEIKSGNNVEYYYDNFSYFFKQLWREDKEIGINILYTILFCLGIILDFIRTVISILLIKHLNPECYLCSWELYYFIIRFFNLVTAIIENENILLNIFNFLAEIVSVLGIMVYLELIELKFHQLDYNLRKNIELRSMEEYDEEDKEEENKDVEKE